MILETLLKYLSVLGVSMAKFLLGPLLGLSYGFNWLEIFLPTCSGMIATSILLSWAGLPLRQWLLSFRKTKPKLFTKRNRRMVRIWRSYGIKGIAFLSPLIFSPPGGTLIAVSFGERKRNIIFWMTLSAIFWGGVFSTVAIYAKEFLLKWAG